MTRSVKDGRTKATKRKASPDQQLTNKRTRVSEVAGPSTSCQDQVRTVKRGKRKVTEDGEAPSRNPKRRRGLLDVVLNQESASSSVESGSSSNNLDGCTSDGDIRRGNRKRKALPAEETQSRKRTKKTETIQDQIDAQRAEFEEKYEEKNQLGEGGCGSVFAGCRREDHLPVAIKHIPKDKVFCKHKDKNGRQISVEVAVMLKLEGSTASSVGHSAPVSLLDWYDLQQELILVLERPMPAEDLAHYIEEHGGSLQEDEAKIIIQQLVDAAVHLKQNSIFHRDIKIENILIETGSDVPRLRLIDFGMSCINKKTSIYRTFYGTSAHVPPEWLNSCTYSAGPTTVWQVGVVLFEMLHNKDFRSTNFIRKRLKISSTLSQDCLDFLEQCLIKVPKQRPTLEQLLNHTWFTGCCCYHWKLLVVTARWCLTDGCRKMLVVAGG
ncbi:serine/threonine-protein kinase pim-1-like [Leuresthes tenuis]|uniref:serine/threonine-protein kinase pim-1-like n=1 Tax=Leuresthes tenuis TaxID=355514 RepID=UPI003B514BBA